MNKRNGYFYDFLIEVQSFFANSVYLLTAKSFVQSAVTQLDTKGHEGVAILEFGLLPSNVS